MESIDTLGAVAKALEIARDLRNPHFDFEQIEIDQKLSDLVKALVHAKLGVIEHRQMINEREQELKKLRTKQ